MKRPRRSELAVLVALAAVAQSAPVHDDRAKSGLRVWVDPETPLDKQNYTSSRGETWELVMSDEFNTPGRSFRPGEDHIWTSLDMPDGVNQALEIYSHAMTTTMCDNVTSDCYFDIQVREKRSELRVWNEYRDPPGYQDVTMFYEAGMVQSWNKFCYQGGMLEVRAQLPGATGAAAQNPDIAKGSKSARVSAGAFYPTWPGVWMMGNLGRALFSASTSRMWPYSYNECNADVFEPSNQRISACDANPGHGLLPNQGRGAPEIDLLEGSAGEISSSIQVAPGMPSDFRIVRGDPPSCVYTATCTESGANHIGVPTATYKQRGHDNWYQNLRYAPNNYCDTVSSEKQSLSSIQQSVDKGITKNKCDTSICPASFDVNADLKTINGSTKHWGINAEGKCFPKINGYTGVLLCSSGSTDPDCLKSDPGLVHTPPLARGKTPFKYQMDAISANWPLHVAAYTDYLIYQVEWVHGPTGYIRWMLAGDPLFEIPAEALTNPPQDAAKRNPVKMLPEEPMYIIMNVAISASWGARPPNPGQACRNSTDPAMAEQDQHICDQFPMHLKIDYVRLYQDVSPNSTMSIGCDPKTHPTKQWIEDHLEEYGDTSNPVIAVNGGGACKSNADCSGDNIQSGTCRNGRCVCQSNAWIGPRCITTVTQYDAAATNSYGPSTTIALTAAAVMVLVTASVILYKRRQARNAWYLEVDRPKNLRPADGPAEY